MRKSADLTGQRFGMLTVLYRDKDHIDKNDVHYPKWVCQCDCGNTKSVYAANIKSMKSCGCLKGNNIKHRLEGQRFGSLVVQYRVGTKNNDPVWMCKCDCGKTAEIRTQCLIKGQISCGCATRLNDLTGQVFGKLTVLYQGQGYRRESDGRSIVTWHCKCECGKEIEVTTNSLIDDNKTSCGCSRKITYKNISGQKFGKLTALYISGNYKNTKSKVWRCKCDCGAYVDVKSSYLINGNTTSCGCNHSKGEMKIKLLLEENGIPYKSEKIFNDLRFTDTNRLARFDIYLTECKYIIEFDGIQHYKTCGWQSESNLARTQKHDEIKTNYCMSHNIPLIRIPYTHLQDLCIEDLLLETTQFRVV